MWRRFACRPSRDPGMYLIQVKRGLSAWVEVPGQTLEVRPDPVPRPEFDISESRFGGCKPDDGRDDAECIERAIAAANAAGGGTVVIGPGTWQLSQTSATQSEGIVLPRGVEPARRGQTGHHTRAKCRRTILWDECNVYALGKQLHIGPQVS